MYPSIFKSRPVFSQAQDVQAHVVLLSTSQTEAEATLTALQLHHKAALLFQHIKMTAL